MQTKVKLTVNYFSWINNLIMIPKKIKTYFFKNHFLVSIHLLHLLQMFHRTMERLN